MKVILQQDVANIGRRGEAYEVSAGYFRNFLQPRGLAVEATRGRETHQKVRLSQAASKEAKAVEQTKQLAEQIGGIRLSFPVKVGDQGRMYGSITARDVAEELEREGQVAIDRHKIVLTEPLRSPGEHSVNIKLDHGIEASLTVDLVPESSEAG
ncbi:MAG TPA: 50S ribosomal protein L9 [Chloroflexota bacterium]|nr:50S ribosomal protein L9 [Chloroflexota bacterium]